MKDQERTHVLGVKITKTAGNIGQCTLIIVLQYYFGFNNTGC